MGAVSYLNTKPMLYGIVRSEVMNQIELTEDYPSNVAQQLREGSIDVALLPVAVMPTIPGARIVSDYGIAADGDVASVSIFSQVPMEEIETVYLDYQSRTSVRLAQPAVIPDPAVTVLFCNGAMRTKSSRRDSASPLTTVWN